MLAVDQIYCQDCLEGMSQIDDASVDVIICDLPYEVLHKNNPKAAWDRIIPMQPLWEQYLRIAKPSAPIILFGQGMFSAQLMMSQPKLWKYNLVWEKDRATGFLNANRMPLRSHEDILVFYREQPVYHPQMVYVGKPTHTRGNGVHRDGNQCYGKHKEVRNKVGSTYDYANVKVVSPTSDPNYRFPKSVLHFAKEHGHDVWHPTQKPVELLRYLIRTFSNRGDLVLDNCMGSGSTAVAAIMEHRHYIGFEMNQEYHARASERIQKARHLAFETIDFDKS